MGGRYALQQCMTDELLRLQAERNLLEDRLCVLEHALNEQKAKGGSASESVDLSEALLEQLAVVNDRLAEMRGPTASP